MRRAGVKGVCPRFDIIHSPSRSLFPLSTSRIYICRRGSEDLIVSHCARRSDRLDTHKYVTRRRFRSRAPDGRLIRSSPRVMTPPPVPSDPAALSADEVAEIRNSHAQLQSLLTQVLEKVDTRPIPSSAQPLMPSATAQAASAFGPPIAAIGVNVLSVIITHDFKAADLHKLDPTNCNRETAYTFNGATNQFEISHQAAKEYKTPFSVLIPLQTFFRIFAFHVNDTSATETFWAHTKQLLELIAEYEWSAVFAYHSVFFNHRRAEMASRDYSQ
ncbi:hypothetical protein E4T56_gene2660 [Termitomyces sp. T112]|nr:hypothetical protein E4T56_gene2660 [Termitomyces sp. T112]